MPKPKSKPELLVGTCQDLLFSPNGGIEGVLLQVDGNTVQVSMPPHVGTAMMKKAAAGKRLRLFVTADHFPKTSAAAHPVFEFESLADADGQVIEWPANGDGLNVH